MEAVYERDATEVRRHLAAGVDVNCFDDEQSRPLHVAVFCGHTEVIDILLDASADVEAKGQLEGTPLHVAATIGRIGAATRTSVDYLPCAYCTSNPPQVEVSLLYSLPSPCRACLLRGTQHILAWNNNNQKHNHSAPLDAGHK